MQTKISRDILSTIIYYDLLDYPLTSFEIWKYFLPMGDGRQPGGEKDKADFLDVIKGLESEEVEKYVEKHQGLYFLKGRENLVGQRLDRNKISEKKFKMVKKTVKWLRFVPFVRGILVTGTVAQKNAKIESDLDLLVILKHGRIFIGRTLVTLLVHLLGRRRHSDKITNRICLNYFITTKSLEIELKDIFSASEYAFAYLLYGGKAYQKFQKKNGWIKHFMPNYQPDKMMNLKKMKDSYLVKIIKRLGELALGSDLLENWLRGWQTERIARDPRTHKNASIIIADDNSLVFLPEPQSPEINRRFLERMEKII